MKNSVFRLIYEYSPKKKDEFVYRYPGCHNILWNNHNYMMCFGTFSLSSHMQQTYNTNETTNVAIASFFSHL